MDYWHRSSSLTMPFHFLTSQKHLSTEITIVPSSEQLATYSPSASKLTSLTVVVCARNSLTYLFSITKVRFDGVVWSV